jgi:hypothetical protein
MTSTPPTTPPTLQIFTVFHKYVPTQIFQDLDEFEKQCITLYGVKSTIQTDLNIVYEKNYSIYNSVFQGKNYNEGSALYHIYANNIHKKTDYIGFTQYDMIFGKDSIHQIYNNLDENRIFYEDNFKWWFLGGQTTIIKDYMDENQNVIKSGLSSYNEYFGTNYTQDNLIRNKMPTCNTFVISSKKFDKMMSWMNQYFIETILLDMNDVVAKYNFNAGHMIEAFTSMFLALEFENGCEAQKMNIQHSRDFKPLNN